MKDVYKVREHAHKTRPHLKWVSEGRANGERRRRYFETQDEAKNWAAIENAELEHHGSRGEMTDDLRCDAIAASKILAPIGITLASAADYYVQRNSVAARSKSMNDVLDELIELTKLDLKNEEVSSEHLNGIVKASKRLRPAFGDRLVSEIQKHEITQAIAIIDRAVYGPFPSCPYIRNRIEELIDAEEAKSAQNQTIHGGARRPSHSRLRRV